MTKARFAPRARRDLRAAVDWTVTHSPRAARALKSSADTAAALLANRPELGSQRLGLAAAHYRFWPLRGFSYVLVYNAETTPITIVRILHTSRDLPTELRDLDD